MFLFVSCMHVSCTIFRPIVLVLFAICIETVSPVKPLRFFRLRGGQDSDPARSEWAGNLFRNPAFKLPRSASGFKDPFPAPPAPILLLPTLDDNADEFSDLSTSHCEGQLREIANCLHFLAGASAPPPGHYSVALTSHDFMYPRVISVPR